MAGIKAGSSGSAGRLSIEIIAEIARLQTDLDKAKRMVREASGDIAKSAGAANYNLSGLSRGMVQANKSAGSMRSGMQQLSFQISDVASQFSSGTPPMQIFAQQASQVVQALQMMAGSTQGVLGFLAGPWGAILTAALVVLTPFVAKLWEAGDAAEDSAKKVKSFATAADLAKQTDALNMTRQELSALENQYKRMAGPSSASQKFFENTDVARKMRERINELKAEIDTTQNVINIRDGQIRQLESEKAAIDAAKKAQILHNKEMREAAKAAREAAREQKKYEESLLGRALSGTLLGQISTELDKGRDEFMKGVARDWARSLQDNVETVAAAQKAASDERVRQDALARTRLIRAAHDFADIIGGGFGRALDRLISALDRFKGFFAELGNALNDMVKGLGSMFKEWLKGAAVGGAAAGLTGGSQLGGMFGGAIGKGFGELAGKALGGIFTKLGGPIGAIAGGILGGVVGGLFKKVKKASATVEIMAGEAAMTSLSGNSAKLKAVAGSLADSLIGGLSSIADQLGGMLGDGVRISIGKRKDTFRVDVAGLGRTKNMPSFETEEEAIQYAIQQAILQGAITGLRAGTERLIKGQGDLEVQLQKALTFEGVFKELAQQANPAKAAIDDITKQFAALRAIFEEAGASAEDYAQLQELMAIKQREVIEQAFEPIRTMLDDLKSKADEAGQAVRDAFDQVLQSEAEAIQAYQDALARQRQAANDNLSAAQQAVADAQEALRAAQEDVLRKRADSLEDMIDKVKDGMQSLKDQAADFADAAQRLREFAKGSTATTLGGLRAQFAGLVARGRAGDLTAMQELPGVGEALRDAVTASATDRVSMMIELAKINADALSVAGVADSRKSMAEKQLAAAEKQVSTLEAQLAATQKQIDELNNVGKNILSVAEATAQLQTAQQAEAAAQAQVDALGTVSEDVLSVADALAQMQTAVAAADQARAQMALMTELNETQTSFADAVAAYEAAKAERDDLLRQITVAGFADLITAQQKTGNQLISALQEVAITAQQARSQAADAIAAAQAAAAAAAAARIANDNYPWLNGIPMFASGGIHAGGLRIVGEDGPELEATGPARYYNSSDTASMLGGPSADDIGKAVREELRPYLYEILKTNRKQTDILKNWDGDGVPAERDVA